MKKLLFIAFAVLTVTASAAVRAEKHLQPLQVSNLNLKDMKPMSLSNKKQIASQFDLRTIQGTRLNKMYTGQQKTNPYKVVALDDIFGTYVEDVTQAGDGTTDYTMSGDCELRKYSYQGVDYVELFNVCMGTADMLGEYDVEDGSILVQAGSLCAFFNEETNSLDFEGESYGEEGSPLAGCYIVAFGQDEKATDLILKVEEDENGKYLVMDESLIGWMVIIAEGTYKDMYIERGDDMLLNAANYGLVYQEYDLTVDESERGWKEVRQPMFLEMIGESGALSEILLHNFIWNASSTISVDAEQNSLYYRNGQDLVYSDVNGGWMGFYTFDETGYMLNDKEYRMPVGALTDGRFLFAQLTEEGDQIKTDWDYLCFGLAGKGWTGVEFAGIILEPFEMFEAEGVNTVIAPTATTASATFNLAGQYTAAAQRGIVVRGGQKLLQK